MKPFVNRDFLLGSKTAIRLYKDYAEDKPIIDFHCHLPPAWIADDRRFNNLTEIWLDGDHYKWRAMRANGVAEEFCTGKASDPEKFEKWAETVPDVIGNPLYHWTHLELARYFDIHELLSPSTAKEIYEKASALICKEEYSTRFIIRKMKVKLICTTDDPIDALEHHQKIRTSFDIKVLPTFRPDAVLKVEDPSALFRYIQKLGNAAKTDIRNFETLTEALDKRHQYFHEHGCTLSDHGLGRFYFSPFTAAEVNAAFRKLLKGKYLSADEAEKFRTAVMVELCKMNHLRGWVQQIHIGAIRNNNARMFRLLGPDTGWDSIGTSQDIAGASRFLSFLDQNNQLAKTILYNLNPADNAMMITMAGNFNDGSVPAKVQCGAAWWFLDQKNGIEQHLRDVSSFGLLRRFVGMVTDSRSLLSYPRHEYFRRLLCNYVGNEVENGLIPDKEEILKPLIEGVCFYNAKEWFDS
jgi:glucuronate isomerase